MERTAFWLVIFLCLSAVAIASADGVAGAYVTWRGGMPWDWMRTPSAS